MKIFNVLNFALTCSLSILLAQAQTQGDFLRQETRLDQVYQQYNLSGQGVIVAMIERGIDYRHPDFIDANGNTRIAYIFDMIDQSGASAPGNTYRVGTIYTRSQIDQALTSGTVLPGQDRYGHGIACTGIAAGDGSGLTGAPYRGAAYGATIIAVKLVHDPFPAGNGQPGQAGFYNPDYLPIALQFVKDKSIELGLPSVTLMNLGSIGGPTDGTSNICQDIDNFVGPGRLFVCGVGDDGGGDNRAELTLIQGNNGEVEIQKAANGNLRFEAWYGGNDRFDITITKPNGTQLGPYTSPASNNVQDRKFTTGINYYHNGSDQDFSVSSNGKRQIMIDFTGTTGTYKVKFAATTVSNGKISASLNPAHLGNNNRFLTHTLSRSSINDFASARKAIVPADYVYRNNYTDIDGINRSRNEGNPGQIWAGSSEGPTWDGRVGIDVAVAGELNMGAYYPGTYYSRFRHLQVENSNGLYGLQNAVSGAAPVLTGVLAIMLEVNPNLTTQEAKSILQQTARSDAFTGTTPNDTWGYGKLDALAAVQATRNMTGLKKTSFSDLGFQVFPNPSHDKLNYKWKNNSQKEATLELLDIHGRQLQAFSLKHSSGSVDLSKIPAGVYLLSIRAGKQFAYTRLLIY